MGIWQKLQELEDFRRQVEVDEELRRLLIRHPEVAQTGLPQGAIDRYARGGVSLVEAYRLHSDIGGTGGTGVGALTPEERNLARAYGMTEHSCNE